MKGRPAYKYGDTIALKDAVAIYAARDFRKDDLDRTAKARARDLITNAVKRKELQPAGVDGKTFLIERFVSWARVSNKFGRGHFRPDDEPPAWYGRYASEEWRASVTHPERGHDHGVDWRARFDGLYEPPATITERVFDFEGDYHYTDEERVDAFLRTTIPIPEAAAPQDWVDALAVALCQIDLLRERNVVLEDRLGKLSKAGKTPRSKAV